MKRFNVLSPGAAADLRAIARYTSEKWGSSKRGDTSEIWKRLQRAWPVAPAHSLNDAISSLGCAWFGAVSAAFSAFLATVDRQ